MFKKREEDTDSINLDYTVMNTVESGAKEKMNTILKGSRLTGNITISCDLELDGDIEGNITAEKNACISIKGTCRGNINTQGGSVSIIGEMESGDIISGGDVKITGTFRGGKIEAQGKISVDGEFHGKLQGRSIEIGAGTKGQGEMIYKEHISVSQGAKVQGQLTCSDTKDTVQKKPAETKVVNLSMNEKGTANAAMS